LDTRELGKTPNTIGIAMPSKESDAGRPVYVRFLLLLVGEAIAGLALYAAFAFMPMAVQMVIVLTSFVIVQIDIIFYPKKNKSLASSLCGITAILLAASGVAWRITHEEVLSRLMLIGACLLAGLIFLDRRQEWFDS
jgi:drug/metabolite transporter (DMT)-like permease